MQTKSLLYLVIGAVLIILILSLERLGVEFIKSTIEPPVQQVMPFPGMFMVPNNPQQMPNLNGKNFAV